jgi:prephenate dehydrogenase
MAKAIITIIGMGLTGTSLGLALQRGEAQAEIVGHDKMPEATQAAKRLNAIHRGEWNLHNACSAASLILLCIPLGEVEETLALIRDDLQPDTLVFVIGDILQPAADLLATQLPGHSHAVVGHPIVNGVGGAIIARADRFEKATFVVAAGTTTAPTALELASNFVETVGAQPLFMDPIEHDGIAAGVEQMPQLFAAMLVHMLAGSPGWTETRRLAGRNFAQSTDPGRSPEHLFAALTANRANVLRRIAQFERELAAWKGWLIADAAAGQEHPLQVALADAAAERAAWAAQAELKDWDQPMLPVEENQGPGFLRQMFLGNLGGKRTEKPPGK